MPAGEALEAIAARLAAIAARSKAKDEAGRLLELFHGSSVPFDTLRAPSPSRWARYGPGIYLTDNPTVADWATRYHSVDEPAPNIRKVFLDVRHPFNLNTPIQKHMKRVLEKTENPNVKDILQDTSPKADWTTVFRQFFGANPVTDLNQALRNVTKADAFYGRLPQDDLGQHTEWTVFNPQQIINPWTAGPASLLASWMANQQLNQSQPQGAT